MSDFKRKTQRKNKGRLFIMNGFIFDLDGTLLDSMPVWNNLLYTMLKKNGITPPADLADRTKTLGLENATEMVLQEFGLNIDPAKAYQMFQDEMEYQYCNNIPLKPGVQEFLDAMTPQYAVICCGADNSFGHPMGEVLSRLEATGAHVMRTDLLGEIAFASDGERLWILEE